VKTVEGRGGNASHRRASQFRLTYYKFKEGGTTFYEPTHEWRRIKTIEEADLISRSHAVARVALGKDELDQQ
jgi:hypothetical protein